MPVACYFEVDKWKREVHWGMSVFCCDGSIVVDASSPFPFGEHESIRAEH